MFVYVIIFKDLSYHFSECALCLFSCLLFTDKHYSQFDSLFQCALSVICICPVLFLVFFFFYDQYTCIFTVKKKKKKINPYFKKMKFKYIFIFLFACFIPCFVFVFVFFFYDQYTCIFTVEKRKEDEPYFKKMKSKHILIFLSDCILLLICLIHFAFLA